jgi:hypothetical protein
MLSGFRAASAAAICVLLGASFGDSFAGEPRTHDAFFLRLSAGGGYGKTSADDGVDEIELSGPAGNANFAIGGIVAPNLALHGTLWGWSVADPDVDFNGVTLGSANNTQLTMSAVGIGITYYIMPAGLYLSPSVGAAIGTLEVAGNEYNTDTGFAFDATIGKEWWVGDGWGLGVAGAFGYHSIPDGDVDVDWTGPNIDIRFTATMN